MKQSFAMFCISATSLCVEVLQYSSHFPISPIFFIFVDLCFQNYPDLEREQRSMIEHASFWSLFLLLFAEDETDWFGYNI